MYEEADSLKYADFSACGSLRPRGAEATEDRVDEQCLWCLALGQVYS